YRVAGRVFDVVNQLVIAPVSQVALAAFATVQSHRESMGELYSRMVGAAALIGVATFFGLAALADPIITIIFGPVWAPSAPLLRIMCLLGLPLCISVFLWPALTALGRGDEALRFGILQLSVSTLFSALAAPFGAAAVAGAYVARGFAIAPYVLMV